MANTKRRTNISIDSRLWKRATAYSKEHDRSLSSLIEQGLRAVLDGSPVMVEHTNLSHPPPERDDFLALIREKIPETVREYLQSEEGAELLRPLPPNPVSHTPRAPTPARTSTPKASPRAGIVGTREPVDVPPEVRERLRQFTAQQVAEASGMDRTVLTKIRSGNRSRIEKGTLEKVIAGLERLESRGVHEAS